MFFKNIIVEHVNFLSIENFLIKKGVYFNFLFVVKSDFGGNGIWNDW